jgi:hypothetical protein
MTKLYKQNGQIVLYLSDGVLHNGVTRVLSAFYINQQEQDHANPSQLAYKPRPA